MGKPRMLGMLKQYIPNSKADRMKNKQLFFHGKDSAESEERLDRVRKKKFRKEKRNGS